VTKQNLTIVLLCLIFVLPSQAQERLVPGEPLTIALSAEAPTELTFSAEADEVITLETQTTGADAPDTIVWLLNPDARKIAYHDDTVLPDGSIQRDATLRDLLLRESGVYTVRVDSFNGVSTGTVTILLEKHPRDRAQAEATADGLRLTVDLAAGSVFRYALDDAMNTATITARDLSGTLDPVLQVFDAAGERIAQNDDHASADTRLNTLDAQIRDTENVAEIAVWDFLGRAGTLEIIIQVAGM